ncbi:unnamed protein product, partial [Bubo scandiacus]
SNCSSALDIETSFPVTGLGGLGDAERKKDVSTGGLLVSFHKRVIYSGAGSTMALPSQPEPAKAIWTKAGAKSARITWERSIESLGIWVHGWSEDSAQPGVKRSS